MRSITTSIVLWGKKIVQMDSTNWFQSLKFGEQLLNDLGYTPNYAEIRGDSFTGGKILKYNTRLVNRIRKSIENNEFFSSISLDVLPENFSSPFDYDLVFSRFNFKSNLDDGQEMGCLLFSCNNEIAKTIDFNNIATELKGLFEWQRGEIFELNRRENSPFIYAIRANSLDSYETLIVKSQF